MLLDELKKRIEEHRKKAFVTCDDGCFCFEAESLVIELDRATELRNEAESGDGAFWNCLKCGFLNYESWQTCAKCDTPHPKNTASAYPAPRWAASCIKKGFENVE